MLRRQARLRREYLYRKNLESQEHSILQRKRKLKHALEDGNSIPTELRRQEGKLVSKMELDDPDTQQETTHEVIHTVYTRIVARPRTGSLSLGKNFIFSISYSLRI